MRTDQWNHINQAAYQQPCTQSSYIIWRQPRQRGADLLFEPYAEAETAVSECMLDIGAARARRPTAAAAAAFTVAISE